MLKAIISLIVFLFITACSNQQTKITLADASTLTQSQLKGKWVIINYWADWCESCVREIPELNHFYLGNKNRIIVLGVNYDQLPQPELQNAIKKSKILFPVTTKNPQKLWGLDNTTVLPTTFIIDPEGKLTKKIEGPTTEQTFQKIVYRE